MLTEDCSSKMRARLTAVCNPLPVERTTQRIHDITHAPSLCWKAPKLLFYHCVEQGCLFGLQEFFQLLMRDMFDVDYGMFKLDEETRMYWFRASKIDMTMEFELVGTMIGLAIYNSHLLEFSFPMLTYRLGLSWQCLTTHA